MKQPATIPPKHKVFLKFVLDPTIEEVSKIGEILYLRPNKLIVRSIFLEVHEIVAKYFYLPPWKHQYT